MGERFVSIGAAKPANSWAGFYNLRCCSPQKRVNSVDVVSRVRDGHPSHNRSVGGRGEMLLFCKTFRQLKDPPFFNGQWVLLTLFTGVKWLWREADNLSASSVCLHGMHRENVISALNVGRV